jgi:hypothetical protein
LPIFRFSKAFGIARDAKVFFNLECGVTGAAVPQVEWYKKQVEKLRVARQKDRQLIEEQRKALRYKERMISGLKDKLSPKEVFLLENELRAKEWRAAGEAEPEVLPDFVIIGAQKSGTTFLYNLLTRHPSVEGTFEKEVHYFDRFFQKGIEWYRSQFPLPRLKEQRKFVTGETTPDYLFHPHAARRMAEVVPQARLIVLLRNPVDRAYSHYHHNLTRKGRETLGFEEAIEAEQARLRGEMEKMLENERYTSYKYRHYSYLYKGIYVDHLLRWSEFYSEEQMLVLKSEDFYEHTLETLKVIQDFLFLPDWQPEPAVLQMIPKRQNRYPKMNPDTRRRLEEYFEPHNRRLYEYLGVDFGW